MNRTAMTVRGERLLRAELDKLKNQERPRVIKAIAVAREHGDLRENAEYHAAREQQSFIEGRINEIEAKLASAEVIDVMQIDAGGRVVFGACVKIFDEEAGEETTYQLVGEDEADVEKGLISYISPIARALINKAVDDVVTISTPSGPRNYEILEVRYGEAVSS